MPNNESLIPNHEPLMTTDQNHFISYLEKVVTFYMPGCFKIAQGSKNHCCFETVILGDCLDHLLSAIS